VGLKGFPWKLPVGLWDPIWTGHLVGWVIAGGTLNQRVLKELAQDIQRAGVRAMMTNSMQGVPAYSADPDVLSRVGNVIGETASQEERHVRASDSIPRSTSKVASPEQAPSGPSIWLWSVLMGTLCTVGLLGMLYWRFG
jgi:hypothetical protein